jgi:energy-coupling factor transporter ATP-binding protein EcfA2
MSGLTSMYMDKFRCFKEPALVRLAPFTVVVGEGRSGKSTLLNALYETCRSAQLNQWTLHKEDRITLTTSRGGVVLGLDAIKAPMDEGTRRVMMGVRPVRRRPILNGSLSVAPGEVFTTRPLLVVGMDGTSMEGGGQELTMPDAVNEILRAAFGAPEVPFGHQGYVRSDATPLSSSTEVLVDLLYRCVRRSRSLDLDEGGHETLVIDDVDVGLDPATQGNLAQWLMSLSMSGTSLVVATSSDHFLRRIQKLVAMSRRGSDVERWLLENVSIVMVSGGDGGSDVFNMSLNLEGSVSGPAPVLRMSGDTETDIFYAGLRKMEVVEDHDPVTHDDGDEPDDVD